MSEQMSFEVFTSGTCSPVSADGQSPCDSRDGQTIVKFSPRRVRASRSARPDAAPDSVTIGIYGPVHTPSSVISAPKSAWESRLMDLLGTFGSTEHELTWKELATPSGQSYYQLCASTARPVDIAGFGLPAEPPADAKPWSALQARDGGQRGNQPKRFLNPDRSNDLPDDVELVAQEWPAVRANRRGCPDSHGVDPITMVCAPRPTVAFETANGINTDGSSAPTATGEPDGSKPGGSLNPAFAAWLQGYSPAHLNCAPSSWRKASRRGRTKSGATATP